MDILSQGLGWAYFTAWSVSFYPQVILNYELKHVDGLSLDFVYLNLVGFALYTTYNAMFLWNGSIKDAYRKRYGGENLVRFNDFVFGLHATILTAVTLFQTFYYRDPKTYTTPKVAFVLLVGIGLVLLAACAQAIAGNMNWLDVLYIVGNVKVFISLCKYIPQAVLNFRRKSTIGWSIHNVLLDFIGGILSVAQELLDAGRANDWSGITGNLAKFLLGFVSMVFDVLFMTQHYVLYPKRYHDHDDAVVLEEA